MKCPKCNEECERDSVDIGVGIIHGPYGCPCCGWSEDSDYDLSGDKEALDEKGGAIDQYGGYWPPGSARAMALKFAKQNEEKDDDK